MYCNVLYGTFRYCNLRRFNCKRFAQSAGLGSEKARLLELCFTTRGSLFSFLAYFSILGNTLGALEAHFWCPKAVWATKGAQRGATPKTNAIFGTHLGVIFRVCFDFVEYVFKHRFLLSPGIDLSWILVVFWHCFLKLLFSWPRPCF